MKGGTTDLATSSALTAGLWLQVAVNTIRTQLLLTVSGGWRIKNCLCLFYIVESAEHRIFKRGSLFVNIIKGSNEKERGEEEQPGSEMSQRGPGSRRGALWADWCRQRGAQVVHKTSTHLPTHPHKRVEETGLPGESHQQL